MDKSLLLIECRDKDDLKKIATYLKSKNYNKITTYSSEPIENLEDILNLKNKIPFWGFIGGLLGAVFGYFLQYYISAINYPLNVGGRPLNSIPVFLIPTFEFTVLFSAIFIFISTIFTCKLPKIYHPLFSLNEFDCASSNGFFICIEIEKKEQNHQKLHLSETLKRPLYEVYC